MYCGWIKKTVLLGLVSKDKVSPMVLYRQLMDMPSVPYIFLDLLAC